MTVWLLTYKHRHGTDTSVYSTEAKAGAAAIGIMVEYFDELEERFAVTKSIRIKIRRAMKADDYYKAIDLWGSCTDETLEIEQRQVDA